MQKLYNIVLVDYVLNCGATLYAETHSLICVIRTRFKIRCMIDLVFLSIDLQVFHQF